MKIMCGETRRAAPLVLVFALGGLVACGSEGEKAGPPSAMNLLEPAGMLPPGMLLPEMMMPPPDPMPVATAPSPSEGGATPVGLEPAPAAMPPGMTPATAPPAAMPPAAMPPAAMPPAAMPPAAETPPAMMTPETPETPPMQDPEDPPEPAVPPCVAVPVSAELRADYDLDPFYTKVALARGVPVLSSDAPADQALIRACELLVDMLSQRPDVIEQLLERRTLFSMIGEDELTNDIPEYRNQPDTINQRARGLGGAANGTCAEESILCNRQLDRWRGEGICVHEYAHTLASAGLFRADPTFQGRLRAAFNDAVADGRFDNTYAQTNLQEYWAEGVQDWYNTNLESIPSNGVHNEIDKRAELEQYDPALYGLIAEFLPANNRFQDCYADVPLPE